MEDKESFTKDAFLLSLVKENHSMLEVEKEVTKKKNDWRKINKKIEYRNSS